MQFETGAVRSNDVDHLRHDLINPVGFREIAKVAGCVNWWALTPRQCVNEALKHTCDFIEFRNVEFLAFAAILTMAALDVEDQIIECEIEYTESDGEYHFDSIPVEGWLKVAET